MNLSKYSQQQKFFVLGLFGFGGALLLLVSEAGRWMTGQVINIDGGWVMRG